MSVAIRVSGSGGERSFALADLPLNIGTGPEAAIRIPGAITATPQAVIGALDERPFLQLSAGVSCTVNGDSVSGTRWLDDGDLVELAGAEIVFSQSADEWHFAVSAGDYDTLPPEIVDSPAAGEAIEPVARRRPAVPAAAATPQTRSKRLRTGFGVALAVLLAVIGFLFTAKAVRIDVEPPEADVKLAGGLLKFKVGGRFLVWPGEYRVIMTAAGYEPGREVVAVTRESSQEFDFVLEKLPGRVVIANDRDVLAQVFVDEQEIGTTPTAELELEPGPHALRVEAERYLPYSDEIDVIGLGQRQEIVVTLTPGWADVTVTSDPAGATITSGDETLGTTPATVPVMAGSRELVVQRDGFKTWRQLLTVEAGEQLDLPPIELQPADGILTVTSVPTAAAVSVDGRYRGTTPTDVELTPGATYEVIVSKPGFGTETRRVAMQSRQGQSIRVALTARMGQVRVSAQPPGGELFVDGRSVGSAEQELSLPSRPHLIEVRKPGFAVYRIEITPKPGLPQVLDVVLLTEAQAVLAKTPRTVTTGQGLTLQLVDPGELTLGAPRRQQGRRPNESQRQVRLTKRFYLGQREVTNTEFREFRPQHTSGAEKFRELGIGDHPAVLLGWDEAVAYCNWLSDRDGLPRAYIVKDGDFVLASPPTNGYRLPTEAEWAWAARYNAGGEKRRYPWGDRMPPVAGSGNFADRSARGIVANVLSNFDDGYPVTAPGGRFTASPLGFFDLGGNVAEWVHDRYKVYAQTPEVAEDPYGPVEGQYHVIRGSSWRHSSISELRFAYRDFGDQGRLDVGFRIARYADEAGAEE